mmetsp:Transcript_3167/g.3495  ORF Transcript_3167/g.3495 Transcript_3167/m.3495 type:complete len:148 (+) Transcript_3167:110-553(+)
MTPTICVVQPETHHMFFDDRRDFLVRLGLAWLGLRSVADSLLCDNDGTDLIRYDTTSNTTTTTDRSVVLTSLQYCTTVSVVIQANQFVPYSAVCLCCVWCDVRYYSRAIIHDLLITTRKKRENEKLDVLSCPVLSCHVLSCHVLSIK